MSSDSDLTVTASGTPSNWEDLHPTDDRIRSLIRVGGGYDDRDRDRDCYDDEDAVAVAVAGSEIGCAHELARPRVQEWLVVEGAPHRFVEKHFTSPSYCNMCLQAIWGLSTQEGFWCEGARPRTHPHTPRTLLSAIDDVRVMTMYHGRFSDPNSSSSDATVCRYRAHSACMKQSYPPLTCSLMSLPLPDDFTTVCQAVHDSSSCHNHDEDDSLMLSSSSSSTSSSGVRDSSDDAASAAAAAIDGDHPFFWHHWVEGNSPPGSVCFICNEEATFLGTDAHRCSRCHVMVRRSHSGSLLIGVRAL